MGIFYSDTISEQSIQKLLDQKYSTLESIKQAKIKLIDQMKNHLDNQKCEFERKQYLYKFHADELKNWVSVLKPSCKKADSLNNDFMKLHALQVRLEDKSKNDKKGDKKGDKKNEKKPRKKSIIKKTQTALKLEEEQTFDYEQIVLIAI